MKKIIALSTLLVTSCAFASVQLDVAVDINGQLYKQIGTSEEGDTISFPCGEYTMTLGAASIEAEQQDVALIAYTLTKEGQHEDEATSGLLMTKWNEQAEISTETEDKTAKIHLLVTPSKQ